MWPDEAGKQGGHLQTVAMHPSFCRHHGNPGPGCLTTRSLSQASLSVTVGGPFESALSLDDCLPPEAEMLASLRMNAVLGVHFQLDSICSKVFNASLWGRDGYLLSHLGWPSETEVIQSVVLCGHDQVKHE